MVLVFNIPLMRFLFSEMSTAVFCGMLIVRSVIGTDRLSVVCPSILVGAGINVESTNRVHRGDILRKP